MPEPIDITPPSAPTTDCPVQWLPGHPLIVQNLEFSSELAGEDLLSAVELAVESSAPVPIEQLAWGWYHDPTKNRVLVYMSLREMCLRIAPDFEAADYVYPAFLAALGEAVVAPCIRLILTGSDISAVYFSENTSLPDWIISRRHKSDSAENLAVLSGDAEGPVEELLSQSLQALKQLIPADQQSLLPDSVTRITDSKSDSNHAIHISTETIHLQTGAVQLDERLLLEGNAAYNCDLRDENFQAEKRKCHLIADRLWKGLIASSIAAAILMALLILNLATAVWQQMLEKEIEAQVPAVNRVEEKESLLASIELFSTAALQPFQALETMNASRPDSLYFRNLRAGAERESDEEQFFIRMRGIASSAAEVDRFAASIRSNPLFSEVELADVRSRNNRTDFNLSILIPAHSETPSPGP